MDVATATGLAAPFVPYGFLFNLTKDRVAAALVKKETLLSVSYSGLVRLEAELKWATPWLAARTAFSATVSIVSIYFVIATVMPTLNLRDPLSIPLLFVVLVAATWVILTSWDTSQLVGARQRARSVSSQLSLT